MERSNLRGKTPLSKRVNFLEGQLLYNRGKFIPLRKGQGGTYELSSMDGRPAIILKPSDEALLCLNNWKGYATPYEGQSNFFMTRVKRGIPLYRTVQTEVLAYKVAEDLGLAHITPKTEMVIFKNSLFHDLSDDLKKLGGMTEENERESLIALRETTDKEKLCSAQEYILNSMDLTEFYDNIENRHPIEGITEREIDNLVMRAIDQKNVEECILYSCLVGETDGNSGNYRLQWKGIDEKGEPVYHLFKIDNALTFTQRNIEFKIYLSRMPQAQLPLSEEGKKFIRDLSEEKIEGIIKKMKHYGSNDKETKKAFRARIAVLKEAADSEAEITLADLCKQIKMAGEKKQKSFSDSGKGKEKITVSRESGSSVIVDKDRDTGKIRRHFTDSGSGPIRSLEPKQKLRAERTEEGSIPSSMEAPNISDESSLLNTDGKDAITLTSEPSRNLPPTNPNKDQKEL